MLVQFFNKDVALIIPQKKLLKTFLIEMFERESRTLKSVAFIFCKDEYLLTINSEFLKHENYTDIITFTLSEPGEPVVGEVYISLERIKDNAVKYNVDTERELYRVIFHGCLHLCGYNDKKKEDKRRMTEMEDKYLALYLK